jgi:hypothetical protein
MTAKLDLVESARLDERLSNLTIAYRAVKKIADSSKSKDDREFAQNALLEIRLVGNYLAMLGAGDCQAGIRCWEGRDEKA